MDMPRRARNHPRAGALLSPGSIRAAFLALALCAATPSVLGDAGTNTSAATTPDLTELPLEQLLNLNVPKVFAASKIEQSVTEAPAITTVVTADEVKKFGYRTLADVLESVQGFNVSFDRNYDFLGAQGVSLGDYNNRVLLLVDGHRVNNNLTDGAAIGSDFILDVDLIDRVEVIQGPGAVLYGDNAFLGVVNVITKQGRQINGVETSFEYGSFESYKGRVTYGQQFSNGIALVVSGTIYDSAGDPRLFYKEFNTPEQNNGVAQNMDGESYFSLFGSLNYRDFTMETAYNQRRKINPTAQFELTTFNDPQLQTLDDRGYAALKYAHSFPDVVDVTAQIYYDSYTHYIGYPQSLLSGTNVLFSAFNTEHDTGEWWGSELELNKTLWDRHVITLGAEYRDDFRQETEISGEPAVSRQRQSYGIYAQGDFAVLSNLHLNAGVRLDQYGHFGPVLDPRLALIYNPTKSATLKAIYGTAFRAPNFEELSDPRFQDISPERITSYELVYEQEIGRYLRSSLSGFDNQMDHLIVFDNGNYTNFNAQTKGVELALQGSWPSLSGRVSYSFQKTKNDTVPWEVPDSPNHLVKISLTAPLIKDKLFAGAEFQYTSSRLSLHTTTDSMGEPITVQGQDAGGYAIINLTLFSHELIKNTEFSATVYNVFNRHFEDPASNFHVQDVIAQEGRAFRLKLTYRF